ncbi:MAG: NAD-dependent epimerase/dehydratase family protein [Acidobacteria bacterium]|nr:NAD-dependent epimerase/dehydratase family protein [Acidobacteriota bacterium]
MIQTGLNRNVLVTGATGFVGRNLVDALLQRGYSVTCLVRKTSDTRSLQKDNVRLVSADLKDPQAVRQAVRGVTAICHLAGLIKAARREEYFRVNQDGTRFLLEAFAEINPALNRFVHISSLAAAGPSRSDRGLQETDPPNPVSWYGESKLKSEQEVLRFSAAFPVTILRPSAVYGPYDRETLLAFRMIKRGCLLTPGRFTRRFSLIHVQDLVAACIKAMECDTPSGEVFFISRPEIYTWGDVGRAIAQKLGKTYRQISFPKWMAEAVGLAGDLWANMSGRPATLNSQKVRELLQPSWICNPSKAREALGFNPAIDLESGIDETVRWYQNRGWL